MSLGKFRFLVVVVVKKNDKSVIVKRQSG